ncbi:hypothetical protein ACFSKN_02570 [Mariniflexile gromovii]|uniref:SGNH/GDSL hydrolase family protein n=1 Tax=Mariniflexile gromovii TaxID=362523 RepID=A0ABS4BPZ3_9FLAO|nr:hypothetical protein [Mariniflexile gromovii]MBP0902488.1 hypothetical protein [Mariniflexile gromovii]
MKKLVVKSTFYLILILLMLEVIVRVFHLYNELPEEYADENGIYKWYPQQVGYSVYGNRRQVYTEYKINSSGYNSYREFKPSKDKFELALLGDSYIEGFHQNFNKSVGNKIEKKIKDIEVYEYGHSSNDFADQMHIIANNKKTFDLIDHIIIRIKYEKDLRRKNYSFVVRQPFFMAFRKSKLVVYLLNIGAMESVKELHRNILSLKNGSNDKKETQKDTQINEDALFLDNFKWLTTKYDINKDKITFLIDSRKTSKEFLNYLIQENFNYIDHAASFEKAGKKPTTLIFDQHWNDYGRSLIANDIVNYILKNKIYKN